jgi:predicted RNase H-like HicB family nuclease
MRPYLMVIERAGHNYSACSPDLPGCVATGSTREETRAKMQQAIAMHLQGQREDHQPIPEPAASAEVIEVAVKSRPRRDVVVYAPTCRRR